MTEEIWESMKIFAAANWQLVPVCPGDHHGMSEQHRQRCSNAGKVPLIRNWTKHGVPTPEEIETWRKTWPDANLGLVFGGTSRIIGIDVDGEGGAALLEELSQGDLPNTLKFTTPGGGMRYLYLAPEGITCRKWNKSVPGKEHEEVALLGEGQMSVLPPSTHSNGGIYAWTEGCDPWTIRFADAPSWMIQLMTTPPQRPVINPVSVGAEASRVLQNLADLCPAFSEDLRIQMNEALDEERWYNWSTLLVKTQSQEIALAFSRLSKKHSDRSDQRIAELTADGGMLRCSTVGCSETQMKKCFPVFKKVKGALEASHSPGALFRRVKQSDESTSQGTNKPD